jgi:DNA-binding transcriptional ArsR family regulator
MRDANAVFKAIAHPARRQILTLLAASDHSVKELTASFTMSQPAVSQHLRELRQARLVTSHKAGSEQKYRLTGEPLKMIFDWCIQYRNFFDPSGHAWTFAPVKAVRSPTRKDGDGHGR